METDSINELLNDMGPHKQQLLAIIDCCREERTSEEIDRALEPLREHRASVYSTISLRALLERAGALTYFSNDEEPEEVYDADGNLVLPEPAVATWRSTEAGIACLEAQDPYGDLVNTLDQAQQPADGFELVLSFCQEEGRSISSIIEAIAEAGIAQDADFDATVFVSKLEDAGALEWRGAWHTTELGARYLERGQE